VRVPNVEEGFLDHLFDLSGKVALVTGGASGLGEAIGLGFAEAGATVVVADINQHSIDELLESVADRGYALHGLRLDVTKSADVDAAVVDVVEKHGSLDVLVNSAGTAARHPAEEFPEDVWDRVVTLNLKGTFLPCQAAGRQMLRQGRGSIINIASIGASVAYPHATAYLQSKGGVLQMTRSLALEWMTRGVRVNALAPSLFDTPLVKASDAKTSSTSEFIQARTLNGRRGQPHELVGPAIFLASDASSMVNGHMLQVDGGYLIA
jgi:NAD(P)-dependent dehydrogenase (short-subunit alcohol dehydrogenase family)